MISPRLSPLKSTFLSSSLAVICMALTACQPITRARQRISLSGPLAGIHPASAISPRGPVRVPMIARGSGHTVPFLPGKLNDHVPVPFLLDSGANHTLVSPRAAESARLNDLSRLRATVTNAFGEEKPSSVAIVETLGLGALKMDRVPVMVHGFQGGGNGLSDTLNVIGTPILATFAYVTLDYGAGHVTFCYEGTFQPPQSPRTISMPLDANIDGHLTVPIILPGLGQTKAIVDTGCDSGILVQSRLLKNLGWQELAHDGDPTDALAPGATQPGFSFFAPEITLGGEKIYKVPAWSGDGNDPILIGSGLLQRFRVTFDFQRMQLWLEPLSSLARH